MGLECEWRPVLTNDVTRVNFNASPPRHEPDEVASQAKSFTVAVVRQ